MHLVLYSKPGCHLCEGLQEKLAQIPALHGLPLSLEIRDITTQPEWFAAYQYEIPVLYLGPEPLRLLPRPSPRSSINSLAQMLQNYLENPPIVDPEPQ
jgi:hypothetical protein